MTVGTDEAQRQMLPSPGWSRVTEPYWLAAGRGELVVVRCDGCGYHRWPPNPSCYHCLSTEWSWDPVPGTGIVYTYTWADWPPPPEGERNVTIVELDATSGDPVRVAGWVVGVERDDLVIGLPLRVEFEPLDDEVAVPVWRPRPPGPPAASTTR